jgi:hypothetical protein
VKASIQRILIFSAAFVAHDEAAHGCIGSVIRQGMDDAEARSTVGAVGEGVTVMRISRVVNLPQAVGANRQVGQDQRGSRAAVLALTNLEGVLANRRRCVPVKLLNRGVGRKLVTQSDEKGIEIYRRRFYLDQHTLG